LYARHKKETALFSALGGVIKGKGISEYPPCHIFITSGVYLLRASSDTLPDDPEVAGGNDVVE
jgi:hypothetical protein